jgi:hypothetical protein
MAPQLLVDVLTDPTARPLLAIRLPSSNGWFVLAGPGASITGYRPAGTAHWTIPTPAIADVTQNGKPKRLTRTAALLPTLATTIQLRLEINGHHRIVTEGP